MKQYIFSYGTLQKAEVQMKLFGRYLNSTKDILKGYKSIPIEITDEKVLATGEEKIQQTLIPTNNENDIIKGTVLEVSEQELILSDKYEPNNYERISVEFASGENAWVYTISKRNESCLGKYGNQIQIT